MKHTHPTEQKVYWMHNGQCLESGVWSRRQAPAAWDTNTVPMYGWPMGSAWQAGQGRAGQREQRRARAIRAIGWLPEIWSGGWPRQDRYTIGVAAQGRACQTGAATRSAPSQTRLKSISICPCPWPS